MSILRQLHHILTVRQLLRQLSVFDMAVKMIFVVAMCRRGVLNSKSKHFLPFGRSPIVCLKVVNPEEENEGEYEDNNVIKEVI